MPRIDFFMDSGIVYGQFDSDDDYFNGSIAHLAKYPYADHNYHAVKTMALKEVDNISRGKTKGRPIRHGFRRSMGLKAGTIRVKVENLFKEGKIKDVNYAGKHESFVKLNGILFVILKSNGDGNPKDRDAFILTNVFIWDKEIKELINPCLITVDVTDFINNEEELRREANKCLSCESRFKLSLIPRKHAS